MSNTPGNPRREVDLHVPAETKAAFRTTEFIAYVVILIGIFIASAVVDSDDDGGSAFSADQAWLYATILTVGYLISRGLAKSGTKTRERRDH